MLEGRQVCSLSCLPTANLGIHHSVRMCEAPCSLQHPNAYLKATHTLQACLVIADRLQTPLPICVMSRQSPCESCVSKLDCSECETVMVPHRRRRHLCVTCSNMELRQICTQPYVTFCKTTTRQGLDSSDPLMCQHIGYMSGHM